MTKKRTYTAEELEQKRQFELQKRLRRRRFYQDVITRDTQSSRIINKFGGVRPLIKALAAIGEPRAPSTVYRWLYGKDSMGTGGIIPTSAWGSIIRAARLDGIHISIEDLDPRTTIQNNKKLIGVRVGDQIVPFIPAEKIREIRAEQEKQKLKELRDKLKEEKSK